MFQLRAEIDRCIVKWTIACTVFCVPVIRTLTCVDVAFRLVAAVADRSRRFTVFSPFSSRASVVRFFVSRPSAELMAKSVSTYYNGARIANASEYVCTVATYRWPLAGIRKSTPIWD